MHQPINCGDAATCVFGFLIQEGIDAGCDGAPSLHGRGSEFEPLA